MSSVIVLSMPYMNVKLIFLSKRTLKANIVGNFLHKMLSDATPDIIIYKKQTLLL